LVDDYYIFVRSKPPAGTLESQHPQPAAEGGDKGQERLVFSHAILPCADYTQ
jgi:hypothetical protein